MRITELQYGWHFFNQALPWSTTGNSEYLLTKVEGIRFGSPTTWMLSNRGPTAFLALVLPPFTILALVMRKSTVVYWLPLQQPCNQWQPLPRMISQTCRRERADTSGIARVDAAVSDRPETLAAIPWILLHVNPPEDLPNPSYADDASRWFQSVPAQSRAVF